jgi:hypothetical protein
MEGRTVKKTKKKMNKKNFPKKAMKLLQNIFDWTMKPARWWQFWRMQSGLVGGSIAGAILVLLEYFIFGRK